MANDRNRYDRDSDREDDGYIARRGFGNARSGYDRGGRSDERSGRGHERERDFGDAAGYGSAGGGRDRGYGREQDSFGSSSFGRGSRDYGEDRGFFERAGDEVRSWFGDDDAERRRDRDMRAEDMRAGDMQAGAQHHRGRGPKGYQRSDERILEDVNDRLTEDPHIDASEIDVSVSGREVTLNGTVNSRFEKRHAEDLAESVSGVTHVQNNLRIQQYADAGMGGSMLSGPAGTGGTGQAGGSGDASPAGTGGAYRRRTPSA